MNQSLSFNILYAAYIVSMLFCALTVFSKKRTVLWMGRAALGLSFAWNTVVIIQRWAEAGRPPMSNMFETLVFFAWCVMLVYLILDLRYGLKALGGLAALVALLSLGFATLVFPDTIEPLMPALQNSFWLTTHVLFCFVGYAAFAIAYLVGLIYLLRRRGANHWIACFVSSLSLAAVVVAVATVLLQRKGVVELKLDLSTASVISLICLALACILAPLFSLLVRTFHVDENTVDGGVLESVLHQTIILGFLFLSVGIITGSMWAQQAWGRYWGWDPKETWSLITWFVYAIYLHLRFGWRIKGAWPVWFAVAGFWAVAFTYFGVNYLLAGLHSYA